MNQYLKKAAWSLLSLMIAGSAAQYVEAVSLKDVSQLPIGRHLTKLKTPRPYRGERPWNMPGVELDKLNNAPRAKRAAAEASANFDNVASYSYLEGPDGSVWFYTADYRYTKGEFEDEIIGFTFNIYDSSMTLQGTVTDDITFEEGETRARMVDLDPTVTTKFFNTDSKPEIVVMFAMNTVSYTNNYYNKVYTIGGTKEDGKDVPVMKVPGVCIDAVNVAADRWSEDFLLAFVENVQPDDSVLDDNTSLVDYLGMFKEKVTVYKKSTYASGPSVLATFEVPLLNIPYDNNDGVYFLTKVHDGQPYFVVSQYEKSFFIDPTGMATDLGTTPDNNLLVDVYTRPSSYATELTKVSSTKIAATQAGNGDEISYTYYGIGSLAWDRDIDMSVNGTPQAPAFLVTRGFSALSDPDNVTNSFVIYNNAGEPVKVLAENTDAVLLMSDIEGQQPQAMFINVDNNAYLFSFVDLYSGDLVMSLDQQIEGQPIQAIGDRVASGDSYKYVFMMSNGEVGKDGGALARVAWINNDGTLDHIDRVNAGKDVIRLSINIARQVLSPYIYDTDNEMEYAVLVGRETPDRVGTTLEFIVVKANRDNYEPLLAFNGEQGLGDVFSFSYVPGADNDRIHMIYNQNGQYNINMFDLPLTAMAGGDGTEANPYLIATVGDLQQIKKDPAAHYRLVQDVDASDFNFTPITNFTGTLDGDGKSINNFSLDTKAYTAGIFSTAAQGAVIKNLRFVNPTVQISSSNSQVGLIAGSSMGATLSDIHLFGLKATGNDFGDSFGGLVGRATLLTGISNCSVSGADINLPLGGSIGGLVGDIRTGVTIKASAFGGKITGGYTTGGIVGETITGDENIADIHVDADIKGLNNVGGVVGLSARSTIERCYVEGTLESTEPGRWNKAYAVGGIVGNLEANYKTKDDYGNPLPQTPIVKNNIVAVKSIKWGDAELTEDYAGQTATQHRVVGFSTGNAKPEILDYDAEGKPVYGDPLGAENCLADNYALASLAPIDPALATTAGTEGQSIDAITRDFLAETLGMSFGTDTTAPWHQYSDSDPWLFFETEYYIEATQLQTVENELFNVVLHFTAAREVTFDEVMDSFMAEWDTEAIEMTGNADMTDNVLTIEFRALKAGLHSIEFNINNQKATAFVRVLTSDEAGIDQVGAPATLTIVYDGVSVSAPGCDLAIYTTAGAQVAAGHDKVLLDRLASGVYIVAATDASGSRAVRKIAK